MNNRQLEIFVTIVEKGSMVNAAKVLYISPPALSQTVKKLEEELGSALFTREKKRLHLSYAGRRFYEFARSTLSQHRQLIDELNDISRRNVGELILSLSIKRANSLLPFLLPEYIHRYPGVKVKIQSDMVTTQNREQALMEGHCDFIITSLPTHSRLPGIEYVPISNEYMTLFSGKESHLAKRLAASGAIPESISLRNIADEEMILPPPIYGGRIMVDQMFSQINKRPRLVAEISSIDVIKSIITTGQYCTLSAEIYLHGKPLVPNLHNFHTIRVEPENQEAYTNMRTIYIAYKKSLPMVTFQRGFIDTTLEVLADKPASSPAFPLSHGAKQL
jgi:DNA-binding transcriptional LysR family regulator